MSSMIDSVVKILLVEDNQLNADMLARRLRGKAYQVDVAMTGEQAISLLHNVTPDILLLDIRLPDISGIDLARSIRTSGHTFPIVAVTADAIPEVLEQAMTAGCNGVVTKPIDFAELLREITEQLASSAN